MEVIRLFQWAGPISDPALNFATRRREVASQADAKNAANARFPAGNPACNIVVSSCESPQFPSEDRPFRA